MTSPKGFYAYPSRPSSVVDTVHAACDQLRNEYGIEISKWEDLRIGGRLIIDAICAEIDRADFVCADLTGYNPNVMFEVGYAIARDKRLWLAIDDSYSDTKSAEKHMTFLTPVGIRRYTNSRRLVDSFLTDEPHEDLRETLFSRFIEPTLSVRILGDSLLYLKSRYDTDASLQISNRLGRSLLRSVVDDPSESSVQTLSWYGQCCYASLAVCAHLSSARREGTTLINARYALVAGLAKGLGRELLIVSEDPEILAPLDYRDLVKTYTTAREAARIVDEWLTGVDALAKKRSEHQRETEIDRQRIIDLRVLYTGLGEYVAENDPGLVNEYFVDTTAYDAALSNQQTIFVGRKGTGKTANLLKLADELGRSRKNLVCTIKPVGYELEGLVSLFRSMKDRGDKGYVVAGLWKYLLLTEIARTTLAEIEAGISLGVKPTDDELALLRGADEFAEIKDDFALRMERAIARLQDRLGGDGREGFAQVLYSTDIRALKDLLAPALSKRDRVAILIDNLDKAWSKTADIVQLSEFLLELLVAAGRLPVDLKPESRAGRGPAVTCTIFLRSDIFNKVREAAREPDKRPVHRMRWDDEELLLRVIDERLKATTKEDVRSADLWTQFFCESVGGVSVREYFVSRILPRPRDLIYFVKAAVNISVNRGHSRVEERDIKDAEKQYSEYALDSIKVENGITIPELEAVLYEFAGRPETVSPEVLREIVVAAKLPAARMPEIVDHLVGLTFLGRETAAGRFSFSYDAQEDRQQRPCVTFSGGHWFCAKMASESTLSRVSRNRCCVVATKVTAGKFG